MMCVERTGFYSLLLALSNGEGYCSGLDKYDRYFSKFGGYRKVCITVRDSIYFLDFLGRIVFEFLPFFTK